MQWLRLAMLALVLIALTLPHAALAQGGESVLDYIARAPQNVAIVCREANAPGSDLNHNAATPFPLAGTGNLAILAEYARQAELGQISPQEPVALADLNRYYLPNVDGGAHQLFLSRLPAGAATITLADVADGMIQYGSMAAADYLLARTGTGGFGQLYAPLGLTSLGVPVSYLGLYLAMSNHETGTADPASLSADVVRAEAARLALSYVNDQNWQTAEIAFRQSGNAGLPALDTQAAFLNQFGMQGSADAIATLLSAVFDGRLSSSIATIMQRSLNWPLRVNPTLNGQYTQFGAISGLWPGILTTGYVVTDVSVTTRVLVILYRSVPTGSWAEWASSGSYQSLEEQALAGGCSVLSGLVPAS